MLFPTHITPRFAHYSMPSPAPFSQFVPMLFPVHVKSRFAHQFAVSHGSPFQLVPTAVSAPTLFPTLAILQLVLHSALLIGSLFQPVPISFQPAPTAQLSQMLCRTHITLVLAPHFAGWH